MEARPGGRDGAIPNFIRSALDERGLLDAYNERPVAQQDHYVRRILRAVRGATVQTRLDQMLDELEGGFYMKKPWRPNRPK
jgi:hypothetical protein